MIQQRQEISDASGIRIQEAGKEQLPEIAKLEADIFQPPWNEQMISASLYGTNDMVFTAVGASPSGKKQVLGYCIFAIHCEDCELYRIAVRPDYRGRGIAKAMMTQMIKYCKEKQGENILLEVRSSNQTAAALYESFGFEEIARRKGYYREPQEDARIMKLANISTRIPDEHPI